MAKHDEGETITMTRADFEKFKAEMRAEAMTAAAVAAKTIAEITKRDETAEDRRKKQERPPLAQRWQRIKSPQTEALIDVKYDHHGVIVDFRHYTMPADWDGSVVGEKPRYLGATESMPNGNPALGETKLYRHAFWTRFELVDRNRYYKKKAPAADVVAELGEVHPDDVADQAAE